MMKSVVAKYLTKYLSEYIETLDKSQMEMQFWEGHATLENLVLLSTAFSSHDLPFKIKKGIIKLVHVNFPWKSFDSEPCVIQIEGVYIIAEPDSETVIQNDIKSEKESLHNSILENHSDSIKNEEASDDSTGTIQSFISNVIDNARILIKNIHIRLEFKFSPPSINQQFTHEDNIVAGGLIIPELSFITVDDNDTPIMKVIHSKRIRKRFNLNNLSVYFDTHKQDGKSIRPVNLNDFLSDMKRIMLSSDHQFILNPFYINGFLIHSRGLPNMLKNVIEITTHQLKFSMDYNQAKAFIYFHQQWERFTIRRYYAICNRPTDITKLNDFWAYLHRCAIFKNRPNEFSPKLALIILKHRHEYLKLIRKYETQSSILHPILDAQLNKLDKIAGPTASYFCREYSLAVVHKEITVKSDTITAFDISEFKGILKSTDTFFEITSFSFKLNIPSFQMELLYEKNNPFLFLIFNEINLNITSDKCGADVHFTIDDFNITSFLESPKPIVYIEFNKSIKEKNYFFEVNSVIPQNSNPFQLNIYLEPTITIIDSKTINAFMTFFDLNSFQRKAQNSMQIEQFEISKHLHKLSYFKNHVLNILIKKLKYVYPFDYQNQKKSINFAIKEFSIIKTAVGILQKDVPEIPMDFSLNFLIDDFTIGDHCVLKEFQFDLPFSFKFTKSVFLDCHFQLGKINFSFNENTLDQLIAAINYGKLIQLKYQLPNDTEKSNTEISFDDFQLQFRLKCDEIKFDLKNLKTAIAIGQINSQCDINSLKEQIIDEGQKFGQMNGKVNIGVLKFYENEIDLLKLNENSVRLEVNYDHQLHMKLIVDNPQIVLNFHRYKNILNTMMEIVRKFSDGIDFESFLRNYSKTYNQLLQCETSAVPFDVASQNKFLLFSQEHLFKKRSKIDLDRTKSQEINPITQHHSESKSKSSQILQNVSTSTHFSFHNDYNEISSFETVCRNYDQNKLSESSIFSFEFVINQFEITIPDKKGDYLVSIGQLLISDKIQFIDFAAYRENRIVIRPMPINLDFDKLRNIEIDHLDSQFEPSDLWAILRLVDEIRYFYMSPISNEDDEEDFESNVSVVFNSSRFDLFHYDQFLMVAKSGEVKINVKLTKTDIDTNVTISQFKSKQFIFKDSKNDQNLTEDPLYEFAEFIEPIQCTYHSDLEEETFNIVFPETTSYFTRNDFQYVFQWIPDDDDLNESVIVTEQYKTHYHVQCPSIRIVLMQGIEQVGVLYLNQLSIDMSWIGSSRVSLDLNINDINGYTDIFQPDFRFIEMAKSSFHYNNDLLFLKCPHIEMWSNLPFLFKLIDALIEILTNQDDKSDIVFSFGLTIEIDQIVFNLMPIDTIGHFLHFSMKFLKYILKAQQRIMALNLSNLLCDVDNGYPKNVINLSELNSTIFLNHNESFDRSLTFDEFYNLEDFVNPESFTIQKIGAFWHLNDLTINYTHQFAHAIVVNCIQKQLTGKSLTESEIEPDIFSQYSNIQKSYMTKYKFTLTSANKIQANQSINHSNTNQTNHDITFDLNEEIVSRNNQNDQPINNSNQSQATDDFNNNSGEQISCTKSEKEDISVLINIDSFHFNFYLIDLLCGIEFLELAASLNHQKWKATMNKLNLYEKDTKVNLIKPLNNSDIVTFEKVNDLYTIIFGEVELSINLNFYLSLVNFLLRSPFLYISELKHHSETFRKNDASLPIELLVKANQLKIAIPIENSNKTFYLDMKCDFHLFETTFEVYVTNFSAYFINKSIKDHATLFDNVTFKLKQQRILIENENKHLVKSNIKDSLNEIHHNLLAFDNSIESNDLTINQEVDSPIKETNQIDHNFFESSHLTSNQNENHHEKMDPSLTESEQIEHNGNLIELNNNQNVDPFITENDQTEYIDNNVKSSSNEHNEDLMINHSMINDKNLGTTNNNSFEAGQIDLQVIDTTDSNEISDEEKLYRTSLEFFLSDIELKLSAIDAILFKHFLDQFKKASDVISFPDDNSNNNSNELTSISFNTANFRLILCKDNKTSSKYIPLFSIAIPPISFNMNKNELNGSKMELTISPFIEYFNETTGLWDMIIEPFHLDCKGELTDAFVQFQFEINFLNVNLPLIAISQYLELFDGIQRNSFINAGSYYVELPNFWINNQTGQNINFHMDIENRNKSNNWFNLGHEQKIPVYQIDQSTEIRIQYSEKTLSIVPKYITYPTALSCDITVVKKPYKGGVEICYKSSTEILNILDFDVSIYMRKPDSNQNGAFQLVGIVKSKKRYPLWLPSTKSTKKDKTVEYVFTKTSYESKAKHTILELSKRNPKCDSNPVFCTTFSMEIRNNLLISVNLSVQNDISTGTRLYLLYSPTVMISHLPCKILKMKIDDMFEYTLENTGIAQDFYLQAKSNQFSISVSIEGKKYGPMNKIKLNQIDKPQLIQTEFGHVTIAAKIYMILNQITTISFVVPCIIYNNTNVWLTVSESLDELKVDIPINKYGIITPRSYFKTGKMPKNLLLNVNKSNDSLEPFEILTPRKSNINVRQPNASKNISKSYIHFGLRYDISIKSEISIVTFSPLIRVRNNLKYQIDLSPFENNKIRNSPYTINPGESTELTRMTKFGIFQLSIDQFEQNPKICLTKEQRSSLKFVLNSKLYLIEVEIIDVETNYDVVFREAIFPTPVVIENFLFIDVNAFHLDSTQPFLIESYSTSMVGYDDLLEYPAFYIEFPDKQQLHISMVDETAPIETKVVLDGHPVYVEVKKLLNNSTAVILTRKKQSQFNEQIESTTKWKFDLRIISVHISLIDLQTREIALLSFDNVVTELKLHSQFISFKNSINSIQFDDQDSTAPNPVCISGRPNNIKPFFNFECLIPRDVPFPSYFSYISATFQRLDVLLDSAFISDFVYLFLEVLKPLRTSIGPHKSKFDEQDDIFDDVTTDIPSDLITQTTEDQKFSKNQIFSYNFGWVELSPILVFFGYNRKSTRQVHQMLSLLQYIPSMSPDFLTLPGIVMANVKGEPHNFMETISSYYKTATFNQVLTMLGSAGQLLVTFGIAPSIAELLGVKIDSDLVKFTSTSSHFASPSEKVDEFDNRKEVIGPFAQESLTKMANLIQIANFKYSPLIKTLFNKSKNKIDDYNLYIKNSNTNGVLGVIKGFVKPRSNESRHMESVSRKRIPRAFPNNKIDIYDQRLAIAQDLVGIDRIRMFGVIQDEFLAVLTDRFIQIISLINKKVLIKCPMDQLVGLSVKENNVIAACKHIVILSRDPHFHVGDENPVYSIKCESEDMANRMYAFIQSQRLSLLTYGVSQLE